VTLQRRGTGSAHRWPNWMWGRNPQEETARDQLRKEFVQVTGYFREKGRRGNRLSVAMLPRRLLCEEEITRKWAIFGRDRELHGKMLKAGDRCLKNMSVKESMGWGTSSHEGREAETQSQTWSGESFLRESLKREKSRTIGV